MLTMYYVDVKFLVKDKVNDICLRRFSVFNIVLHHSRIYWQHNCVMTVSQTINQPKQPTALMTEPSCLQKLLYWYQI